MLLRPFGKTGWDISAIGLGTWNIGHQWGEIDETTAWATVRAAYEHGMNLFDTADAYGIPHGLSEDRLGRALAGLRHRVFIVSKAGNYGKRTGQGVPMATPDMVRLCVHASLGRLRTDWLDVALCHEGNIKDPSVYLEGFEQLVKEGRVRAYGISTNRLDVLKRFNANGTCAVVQVDYSLLNRQPEEAFLPYCQEHGIGVLVRGPLAMGLLSGRYSAQTKFSDTVRGRWHTDEKRQADFQQRVGKVERLKKVVKPGREMVEAALRYVLSHPSNPVAIPGAKDPGQAKANAQAGERALAAEERSKFLQALDE